MSRLVRDLHEIRTSQETKNEVQAQSVTKQLTDEFLVME